MDVVAVAAAVKVMAAIGTSLHAADRRRGGCQGWKSTLLAEATAAAIPVRNYGTAPAPGTRLHGGRQGQGELSGVDLKRDRERQWW